MAEFLSKCCGEAAEQDDFGEWICSGCGDPCEVEEVPEPLDRDDVAYLKARFRGWED